MYKNSFNSSDLKWQAPEMEKIENTFSAVLHYK